VREVSRPSSSGIPLVPVITMWKILLLAVIGLVGGRAPARRSFLCFDNVHCESGKNSFIYDQTKCTAEWGAFPRINKDTNELISQQLNTSLEYLLIASHFKDWRYSRPGFASYFSKLSDDNWNEAISLLTHMVERGGNLVTDFEVVMPTDLDTNYQLQEIEALSKALDKERKLATKTLHLAHLANHGQGVPHDSEFAEFLAKRLHHNSVLRIKHLANYVNLLSDIINGSGGDSEYAIFKFDSEYLK